MNVGTLLRLPQAYKNLARVREILSVAIQYGWGDWLARMQLETTAERLTNAFRSRRKRRELIRFTTGERVRLALEELGPTFIKFGQILATRPDLIPLDVIHELRKLQDDVPPFPGEQARQTIERELGGSIETRFADFDTTPLAAASIAQVHRAKLRTGEEVVVKVRRPGLAEIIATDLDILLGLATLIEENIPESRQYAPRALAEEFRRSITLEIDLRNEAQNYQRFARNFAGHAHVHVPQVHTGLSTEEILTVEFIDGIKATDLPALEAAGLDRKRLARQGVDFVMEQVFIHGFFHADPHPGNIFVLPDHRFAPIDMGMMGQLDREMLDHLLEMIVGILLRDPDKIIRLFRKMELVDDDVDRAALHRDLRELIQYYYAVPIGEIDISTLITQLFEALARHRVKVPPELLLIGKAMATVEGMARDLDPSLDPIDAIRPFALKLYLQRLSDPRYLTRDLVRTARGYVELAERLPRDLSRSLGDLARGELGVRVEVTGMERSIRERARSANRLALAALVSALLIGSAWLVGHGEGPALYGIPASVILGGIGFGLAAGGYLLLAYGFLRSGRF